MRYALRRLEDGTSASAETYLETGRKKGEYLGYKEEAFRAMSVVDDTVKAVFWM